MAYNSAEIHSNPKLVSAEKWRIISIHFLGYIINRISDRWGNLAYLCTPRQMRGECHTCGLSDYENMTIVTIRLGIRKTLKYHILSYACNLFLTNDYWRLWTAGEMNFFSVKMLAICWTDMSFWIDVPEDFSWTKTGKNFQIGNKKALKIWRVFYSEQFFL